MTGFGEISKSRQLGAETEKRNKRHAIATRSPSLTHNVYVPRVQNITCPVPNNAPVFPHQHIRQKPERCVQCTVHTS